MMEKDGAHTSKGAKKNIERKAGRARPAPCPGKEKYGFHSPVRRRERVGHTGCKGGMIKELKCES